MPPHNVRSYVVGFEGEPQPISAGEVNNWRGERKLDHCENFCEYVDALYTRELLCVFFDRVRVTTRV